MTTLLLSHHCHCSCNADRVFTILDLLHMIAKNTIVIIYNKTQGQKQIPCINTYVRNLPGFPGSSAGKEYACNSGDSSSIPGLGRSPGEGIGYPLQYSWASLVAQMVKNRPAMWETWIPSLSWEDSLQEGMETHSSILAWRIATDRAACWASSCWATVHGVAKSRT